MISLASSAFNIESNDFDIQSAIKNWELHVDEIVISTIPSDDNSLNILKSLKCSKPIKIIEEDFSLEDPEFDGKLKNSAHQNCSNEIIIQCDLDERLGGDPQLWRDYSESLLNSKDLKALLLPVIDLYGSYYEYSSINKKWYMAKREGTKRGVVSFARKEDGKIDIEKSDTCELLDENDNLVPYIDICDQYNIDPLKYCQSHNPFIWHLGYIDIDRRSKINSWWKPHWESRKGESVEDIKISQKDLEQVETHKHNIQIDFL
jgi:hypothetical protein